MKKTMKKMPPKKMPSKQMKAAKGYAAAGYAGKKKSKTWKEPKMTGNIMKDGCLKCSMDKVM